MIKKTLLLFVSFTFHLISFKSFSQDIYVGKEKSTTITFLSVAPLEKITSTNKAAIPVFNSSTGDFQIRIPMRQFEFQNQQMKEHFNENFVESEKYPYCVFKGKSNVTNFEEGKEYTVTISGIIELHGVKKELSVTGQVKKQNSSLFMNASFDIVLADFNIEIPKLLSDNIAKQVKVTFNSELVEYKKK
jgi:polyisoprenoid-binding protein YceI